MLKSSDPAVLKKTVAEVLAPIPGPIPESYWSAHSAVAWHSAVAASEFICLAKRTYANDDAEKNSISKAKQALKEALQETAGPEVAADLHILKGRAAIDIVKFAKSHVTDLIVIATLGLMGIRAVLLGSVTEKVVRRAPCPVFTMKRFGKSPI